MEEQKERGKVHTIIREKNKCVGNDERKKI